MHRSFHAPLAVLASALVACQSPASTRVRVEVTADPALNLDGYQLRIGERAALVDPLSALELELPGEMAGTEHKLSLWGLASGDQVAYGTTMVTPILDGTVDAAVTLSMVECGTWCTLGSISCSDNGTITCVEQADGCVGWSAVAACPSETPYCSNGECDAECVDECNSGQTLCDSAATVLTCGEFDQDSCADWSPPAACASGATCSGGVCGEPVACANNGDGCDDGDPCTSDDACDTGTCSGVAKCDTAPAHAQPTCSLAGTCGFTCDPEYVKSGSDCVPRPPRLVFVSTGEYHGNLGGLAGADAKCQSDATTAGLTGVFKAWLSTSTTSAASRFTHSTVPYALVNGTLVAEDWSSLVSETKSLLHDIDLTATGGTISIFDVYLAWTGTDWRGAYAGSGSTCNNWTSTESGLTGLVGETDDTGYQWSQFEKRFCATSMRLYCFEQ